MVNDTPLYTYSIEEAKRLDQLDLWRESYRANVACREAIETAIKWGFDGMHLKEDCTKGVIHEFGYRRTSFVLANTLRELDHDGRFSSDNKEWGRGIYVPPDPDHNYLFTVASHPAVLDGFIREFREELQALQLYGKEQCVENARRQDFEGKVLVLSPDSLKEKYWEPEYQLWYAHDGFGCSPTAVGRSVRATCLADGETVSWDRGDFLGPIQEELLPNWAKERVAELWGQGQEQTDDPAMDGMTMG